MCRAFIYSLNERAYTNSFSQPGIAAIQYLVPDIFAGFRLFLFSNSFVILIDGNPFIILHHFGNAFGK